MGKKNNKDENKRLPMDLVKDKNNTLRLKIKETIEEAKFPKKFRSSMIIVSGILAIVLIAILVGNVNTPPEQKDLLSDSGLNNNVVITEEGQITAQVPSVPDVKLDGAELTLDEEKEESPTKEEAETTMKVVETRENENLAPVPRQETLQIIYPLRRQTGIITEYGWYFHPVLEVWRFHNAVDLRGQKGELVMAGAPGKVIEITDSGQEAIKVTIEHDNGWRTVYGQIGQLMVKKGANVVKGQKIGKIGDNISAVEPHLHFEIISKEGAVDPRKYLQ